ncbi:RNA polymerase sigma factor [Flexivirga alba]|uniref:RNA polymerase sigma factor n=1 Tax=Flexivirga alba TaxID=702742 RepID=A0ABW2AFB5_9MICO
MEGSVEGVWRREAPHVLAALQRRGATLEDCEDAAQEALTAAAIQWPADGPPANPRGWLIRVASRRLIDAQRSAAARPQRELRAEEERATWSQHVSDHDDSLQMLVLCCHPTLSTTSAVALTLRAVAGLTTGQIAAGLLVPETTAAQRISRAKSSLRTAKARFGPVPAAELPARLHAVRTVLHLIFTTGSSLPAGPRVLDTALTQDAIRLTERLHRALPRDPETTGLLALMLLGDARATTRVIEHRLVPLAEQDRTRWDHAQIERAVGLVEEALPRGPVGPFQLQAAIAAVHATAPDFADTDWPQILELYRMLLALGPNPAAELGAAIALSEVDGAEAGLAALEPLADARPRDHRVIAAQAHLLERLRRPGAADAFRRAAALTDSIPEQNYLNAKAAGLS